MNGKNTIKIIIDIIMAALIVTLFLINITGFAFHEIAGITMLVLIGLHLLLNRRWITGVSKKLFNGGLNSKTAVMYTLNIGLLLSFMSVMISGFMISTFIWPHNDYNQGMVLVHRISAYIMAGLGAVHVALHARYLIASIKKIINGMGTVQAVTGIIGITAATAISVVMYYNATLGRYDSIAVNPVATATAQITAAPTFVPTPLPSSAPVQQNESTILENDDTSKSNDTKEIIVEPNTGETSVVSVTLQEYLSKLFCTACPRHCPLSHPQCRKSATQIANATSDYNALYGDE